MRREALKFIRLTFPDIKLNIRFVPRLRYLPYAVGPGGLCEGFEFGDIIWIDGSFVQAYVNQDGALGLIHSSVRAASAALWL